MESFQEYTAKVLLNPELYTYGEAQFLVEIGGHLLDKCLVEVIKNTCEKTRTFCLHYENFCSFIEDFFLYRSYIRACVYEQVVNSVGVFGSKQNQNVFYNHVSSVRDETNYIGLLRDIVGDLNIKTDSGSGVNYKVLFEFFFNLIFR